MASVSVEGRNIVLPTGTVISILNDKSLPLPLLDMGESVVAVVFPKDDVDFQVSVDNRNSERGISFQLTINKNSHWYSIEPKVKGEPMQALVAKGRKLHFMNQETGEGKQLVAETAQKYGMKFDEAREMCSRIQFEVKVHQLPQRTVQPPALKHYHFHQQTTFCAMAAPTRSTPTFDYIDSAPHGRGRRPVETRDLGDRGIIVFGDESDQKFGTSKAAKFDDSFTINPFSIELRMQSKYAAV